MSDQAGRRESSVEQKMGILCRRVDSVPAAIAAVEAEHEDRLADPVDERP